MRELVNHILAVADKNSMNITNLQLQKILYFSFLNLLEKDVNEQYNLEEMYRELGPFLVWRYGPVNEKLYNEFRKYGSTPILERGSIDSQFDYLNDSIIELLKENPFDLVERSHGSQKWQENEDKIKYGRSRIAYQLEDLRHEVGL